MRVVTNDFQMPDFTLDSGELRHDLGLKEHTATASRGDLDVVSRRRWNPNTMAGHGV